MCQGQILNCLEKSKIPLSTNEISLKTKLRERAIQRGLRKMIKYSEIPVATIIQTKAMQIQLSLKRSWH